MLSPSEEGVLIGLIQIGFGSKESKAPRRETFLHGIVVTGWIETVFYFIFRIKLGGDIL